MNYEWYEPVQYDAPVSQGDIILKCRVPKITDKEGPPYFKLAGNIRDVIVMTQACDLANNKTDLITLCPLMPLSYVVEGLMKKGLSGDSLENFDYSKLTSKQIKSKNTIITNLKSGFYLDFHVINEYKNELKPLLTLNYQAVSLKETFTIPKKALEKQLLQNRGERLTLLPPYREHLAQAYARNFFRIGLPIDLNINSNSV